MNLTRTADRRYSYTDDEAFHPLWLGILILFGVILIIGLISAIRIKCRSTLRNFTNRLFHRNNKRNERNSRGDNQPTLSYTFSWPPAASLPKRQSPKLYTLIKNIRIAELEKQLSLPQQSVSEEAESTPIDIHQPQVQKPSALENTEIARKFFASMRDTSYDQGPPSISSFDSNASLASNTSSAVANPPTKSKRQNNQLFYSPGFFQLTSNNI